MEWSLAFFIKSVLLGVGLAMDAFSVSMANGPDMRRKKMCATAGVFALFQAVMPMIGWICVHTLIRYFTVFSKCIPWIALVLLLFIGGKMLKEGIGNSGEETTKTRLGIAALLVQGIATSIDALSVGFTIAEYGFMMAFVCAFLISVVTFVICMAGLVIGKKFGTALSGRAAVLGGIILIAIGVEIFISGVF